MEYLKIILFGVLGSFAFMFFTLIFGSWIGTLVFTGGDAYESSYHMFTRMGLVGLSGIIVTCTVIIVIKINEVITLLKNTHID